MKQQIKRQYEGKELEYIEGNIVRKAEAAPDQRGEEVHRELEHRQRTDREREEKQRQARLLAKKNQQKAMQMSPGYVVFLLAAVAVLASVCTIYLQLQSEISGRMKRIATLENQVMDLAMENDAAQKRIDTSINMETVRQSAIHELGMVYPAAGQIQYFQVNPEDYMNQYEDIPEK